MEVPTFVQGDSRCQAESLQDRPERKHWWCAIHDERRSSRIAYLDPSMHHYAAASGETVIQIHGMSPVKFNYINPADDPSPKK